MATALDVADLAAAWNLDTADRGSDAYYFHIPNTKWGVKFFLYAHIRDTNYDRQAVAITHGIAPQLGDKVDCEVGGQRMFGFVTEHVGVYMRLVLDHFGLQGYTREHECPDSETRQRMHEVYYGITDAPQFLLDLEQQLMEKIETLDSKLMREILYDFHDWNWGVTEDGRPVVIDFSRAGCGAY